MRLSFDSLVVIGAPSFQAFFMDYMMIPFFQHPKLAFVFVQAKGQGCGWLLGHLFVRFPWHTLLSP
jgi:hypothetical protein